MRSCLALSLMWRRLSREGIRVSSTYLFEVIRFVFFQHDFFAFGCITTHFQMQYLFQYMWNVASQAHFIQPAREARGPEGPAR